VDNVNFVQALVDQFLVDEQRRNDPDNGPAQPDRFVGHNAHHPVLRAAIDDAMAL
jgi:hypothetical protein